LNHDIELASRQYRTGMTLRQIAVAHGVTHPAVAGWVRKFKWNRDLSRMIVAEAEQILERTAADGVAGDPSDMQRSRDRQRAAPGRPGKFGALESDIVEVNARILAGVRLQQRSDIKEARNLGLRMLRELGDVTENGPLFDELKYAMAAYKSADGGDDARNAVYKVFHRTTGLPGRVKVLNDLAGTLNILIAKEREAYNLDAAPTAPPPAATAPNLVGKTPEEIGEAYMRWATGT
jgi:hypothetical protein